MMIDSVTIPVSPWFWPAGALLIAGLALMVWSYWRAGRLHISNLRFGIWRVAFLLKLLGIVVLALCLIEPLWSGRRAKSGANLFIVLADNSSGMNIRDRDASRSRGEILQDLLNVQAGLRPAATGAGSTR